MSVLELEQAISQLTPEELSRFSEWFDEFKADQWDKQIEQDVAAGKFDRIIAKVDADIDAGRSNPL
jgi:hypothetical protein